MRNWCALIYHLPEGRRPSSQRVVDLVHRGAFLTTARADRHHTRAPRRLTTNQGALDMCTSCSVFCEPS